MHPGGLVREEGAARKVARCARSPASLGGQHETSHRNRIVGVLLAWASAGPAFAQQEQSKEVVKVTTTETTTGPKYLNLRYDEDFSYLGGEAGSYREDFFDPIKNIKLSDDFRLSIGGEFRFQMKSLSNGRFGARAMTHDNWQLYRLMTHFDLKYQDSARLFVQFASMLDGDNEFGTAAIDENQLTVHQAFLDLKPFDAPLTLRFGRQELSYGKQEFFSPLEWANVRRRFDAIKAFWQADTWQLDVFAAKPVVVRDDKPDPWADDVCLWGAYWSYTGFEGRTIDVFAVAQDDKGDRVNPNGRAGDMDRYTLGATYYVRPATSTTPRSVRGSGATGPVTGSRPTPGASAAVTLSRTTPASRGWVLVSTGPAATRTGGTARSAPFDQLYPLGHAYFGYLDLVGRQNIQDLSADLSAWAVPDKVKAKLAYHMFWLEEERDALYDAGGAALRRDFSGRSGDQVGQELDVTLHWQMCPHSSLLLGYSHFWCNDFIIGSGPDDDPDLFYIQYAFKF